MESNGGPIAPDPGSEEERKLAGVPLTLTAVMGAFLVIAAVVAMLIWAI